MLANQHPFNPLPAPPQLSGHQSGLPGPEPQPCREAFSDSHGLLSHTTSTLQPLPENPPYHGLQSYWGPSSCTGMTQSFTMPDLASSAGNYTAWAYLSGPTYIDTYATTQENAPSATTPGAPSIRKKVRAQQACNHCRQRKQKCDEARPCAYCKQEGLQCEYKEVPLAKPDRTLQEISRKIDDLDSKMMAFSDTKKGIDNLQGDMKHMRRQLDTIFEIVSNMQQRMH